MMSFSGPRLIKMKAGLLILLASVSWSLAQQEQLSQNIVTDEVRTEVIKTKYGRVQGFISRVGRDASSARYVQIFLGVPYASPPTGNYRSNILSYKYLSLLLVQTACFNCIKQNISKMIMIWIDHNIPIL